MRLVDDPAQAEPVRGAPAVVAVMAAIAAGGCGDGSPDGPPVRPTGSSQASTATCEKWTRADRLERAAILGDLERAFGRRYGDGQVGEIVPRAKALAVMDNACSRDFADNFRLWKLYERAVAFG